MNAQKLHDMRSASAGNSAERPRHSRSIALAAVTCAVAIAACGSSGKSSSASAGSSQNARAIECADCMRSHGVPNFPDPNADGVSVLPATVNQQSPALLSAEQGCAKLQPGASGASPIPERRKLQLIAIAACMRKHGVPNLPDPSFHGATVNLGGSPKVEINMQSPAFKQAAAICKFPTPRGGVVNTVAPPG